MHIIRELETYSLYNFLIFGNFGEKINSQVYFIQTSAIGDFLQSG